MSDFKTTAIDAKSQRAWDETLTAFMLACPSMTALMVKLCTGEHGYVSFVDDGRIKTAATDGYSIFINPAFFFKLSLKKRVFVLAHEIMHIVYMHPQRAAVFANAGKIMYPDGKVLDYNDQYRNYAQDYCINDLLCDEKVGECDPNWLRDKHIGTAADTWTDIYRRIYHAMGNPPGGGGGSGGGQAPGGQQPFDQHLDPGQGNPAQDPPTAGELAAREQEIQDAVAVAADIQNRMKGEGESVLGRAFKAILTPKVRWQDKLFGEIVRAMSGVGAHDFRKVDRRLLARGIVFPAATGFQLNTVAVAYDTSGSISPEEIGAFNGELMSILEDVMPRQVVLLWCHQSVHRTDTLESPSDMADILGYRPPSGGTDFIPVFEKLDEMDVTPDVLVYLTDGIGVFPERPPSYKTIWGDILGQAKFPFGEVVDLREITSK